MKQPAPSAARKIFSWVMLVLIIALPVVAFSAYIGSLISMPWWQSAIGGGLLLAALVGYVFGLEALYKHFCGPLGLACELRPVKPPVSVRADVDLVITGKYLGRPFTLYREKARYKSSTTTWGVLEWVGDDIRLPTFTLEVGAAGSGEFEDSAVAGALTKAGASMRLSRHAAPVEFAADSNLSRRSKMTAADQAAVSDVFTPAVCEALDPLLAEGSVESKPGRLVIRQQSTLARSGFPLPWRLEEFLKQGEQMRRLFMP